MTVQVKRIYKSVLYKRVEFFNKKQGDSLKTLLDAALKKRSTVGARRRNVGDDDSPMWQLIGSSRSETDAFSFGMLMTYSPGTDPLFLVDDASAESITLEKLSAPNTKEGKRRELLESVMFFGCIRNHLVIMQSQALKAPHFEQYLTWLLRDAKVMAGDNYLSLIDTPTQAIRDRVEGGNGVRQIKLGSEVMPASAIRSASARSQSETKSVSVTSKQQADWGPLEALKKLMEPSDIAKIDFDQLAGSNIELTVTLRYRNNTTTDGAKLMDTLGAVFRNTDDVETEIELTDGTTIKGSDLKLHGQVRLSSYDGQLSESEVNEELRQWLLNKIKAQEV